MTHPPTSNKRARGGGNNAANGKAQNVDDDDDMSLSSTIPPPDGGWGWMVVLGSFMIHVVGKSSKKTLTTSSHKFCSLKNKKNCHFSKVRNSMLLLHAENLM